MFKFQWRKAVQEFINERFKTRKFAGNAYFLKNIYLVNFMVIQFHTKHALCGDMRVDVPRIWGFNVSFIKFESKCKTLYFFVYKHNCLFTSVYIDKTVLSGCYVIQSTSHPKGSQRPLGQPQRFFIGTCYSHESSVRTTHYVSLLARKKSSVRINEETSLPTRKCWWVVSCRQQAKYCCSHGNFVCSSIIIAWSVNTNSKQASFTLF